MVKYCVLFSIALTIGIATLVASILLYTITGGDPPLDYGLVLDAGSSHTQFTLYKWHGEKDRNTGWVEQLDTCNMNDPLSKFDPELAGPALQPCLVNVTSSLPIDKKLSTQVFLGATAGFRILNKTEPYLSEAVLISVQCTLRSAGLLYKKADIISGHEEGLFGWITTNFLGRTLQSRESKTSLGALDLGGASTQISYSLNTSKDSNYETQTGDNATITLKLYGKSHIVKATSYLCYGVNEIYNRHLALLVKNLTSNQTNFDPCSPKGFQQKLNAVTLFGQACTKNDRYDEYLFKNRYVKDNIFFTFNGTGDSSQCEKIVSDLLDPVACEQNNFTDCFSPPLNVPTDTQKFVAFSTFYYLTKFLNATSVTLNEYRRLKTSFCDKSWEEAQDVANSGTVTTAILSMICFEAHYVDLLLTDKGYGFDNTTWSNLQFLKKMNHSDVGWSMGYMINATNSIPAKDAIAPEINLTVMIILIIIGICLLGTAAFFFRKRRSSNPDYLHV